MVGPDRWTAVAALADSSRRALYEYVRRAGYPVGRDEAGNAPGISRGLAAFHLDKLVEAGLLRARHEAPAGRPRGRGRAPKVYEPAGVGVAVAIPERRYELIAEILADAVATEPADAARAASRLARQRGGGIGARPPATRGGPARGLGGRGRSAPGCPNRARTGRVRWGGSASSRRRSGTGPSRCTTARSTCSPSAGRSWCGGSTTRSSPASWTGWARPACRPGRCAGPAAAAFASATEPSPGSHGATSAHSSIPAGEGRSR